MAEISVRLYPFLPLSTLVFLPSLFWHRTSLSVYGMTSASIRVEAAIFISVPRQAVHGDWLLCWRGAFLSSEATTPILGGHGSILLGSDRSRSVSHTPAFHRVSWPQARECAAGSIRELQAHWFRIVQVLREGKWPCGNLLWNTGIPGAGDAGKPPLTQSCALIQLGRTLVCVLQYCVMNPSSDVY